MKFLCMEFMFSGECIYVCVCMARTQSQVEILWSLCMLALEILSPTEPEP